MVNLTIDAVFLFPNGIFNFFKMRNLMKTNIGTEMCQNCKLRAGYEKSDIHRIC